MAIIQMWPENQGLRNSITFDGRTYSSIPGVAAPVLDSDVAVLQANGWTTFSMTGGKTTITMLSPAKAVYSQITINGHTYSTTPGVSIEAPLFDAATLQANGWTLVQLTGVTLQPLTLSAAAFRVGDPQGTVVGSILGASSGSTIAFNSLGMAGALQIAGTSLQVGPTPSGSPSTVTFNLVETLTGATNTPNQTNGFSVSELAAIPVNTVVPTITGTAQVGQTLTATNGTWTNGTTSFTYQWNRAGTPIGGATASTYVPVAGDIGNTLTVSVVARNSGGSSTPATSAATSAVTAAASGVPANTALPAISGTPQVGQTLTATNGTWTNGPTSFTYQWTRSNLLRDTTAYASSGHAKPAYLGSFVDPIFKTKITRITGDVGATVPVVGGTWPELIRPGYNTRPVWNADQSMMYIDTPGWILNGTTYQPIAKPNYGPQHANIDQVRWHPTIPSLMQWAGNGTVANTAAFGTLNPLTGATVTKFTIPGYAGATPAGAGTWKPDGTMVGVTATRVSDGAVVMFAVDLVNNIKYPDIVMSSLVPTFSPGATQISNDGTLLLNGGSTTTPSNSDMYLITDIQGNLVQVWTEYGVPSHGQVTQDAFGNNVFVGVVKTPTQGVPAGHVAMRNMRTGVLTDLDTGGWPIDVSVNPKFPGWAFADSVKDGTNGNFPPYRDEIFAVKLDGSKTVVRLGQTYGDQGSTGSLAISSITWAANVATVSAAAPLPTGWDVGNTADVVIAGAAPAGYNGPFHATVTGASTFTYPLAVNPGVETTPGTFSATGVSDYSNQGFVVASPDGKRVIFGSTWNATTSPMRPISLYVIDLRANWADIAGANSSTYPVVSADIGDTLTASVIASNAVGSSTPATSVGRRVP